MFLDQVNFITEDRMHIFIWKQKSECSIILDGKEEAWKEKDLALIKRVKLTEEFEKAHEVACLLNVGPSGLESLSW